MTTRKVAANISITLDGRYNGPGGPGDLSPIVPYMGTDTARDHMARMCEGATTALLSRGNGQGFLGYWSPMATDENADPRDRGYAKWLVDAEKVILSTTLTDVPWERTRVLNAPAADAVTELRSTGTGDILVNTSPSILKALLAADLVDRLYLIICPAIAGGGDHLFEDGLPGTRWQLTFQETGEAGEVAAVYDRIRAVSPTNS
ncbi:dihydrofolate reductase family protein [Nocardia sp. NBC_01503]|uniref:dihydrofolate reductase family protein n=1 Tax=Nocardia sp. NBC_01503 TaxID=2975997 RepID=UPI002E7B00FA|nr:dihydrofolate reductase family protein [Nocardia sp. NBC_01503]WTL31187.1 dihydrofolate reductase family protein [Nocardia sp. NBC_01503]